MKILETTYTVKWGDCDPNGDMLYPRMFAIFDEKTWEIFDSVGITPQIMLKEYNIFGTPMVKTSMQVESMPVWQDTLQIRTFISRFNTTSFCVSNIITKDQSPCLEGQDIRVWAAKDPHDDERIVPVEIPTSIRELFI